MILGGQPLADYHYWHYGTGQRTAKIVDGRVTHFDYAPWGPLLSESVGDVLASSYPYADVTALAYTDYVYLDDLPLARIEPSGAIAYLHPNHLAAPLVATNDSGEIVWRTEYEPFGQAQPINPSLSLNLRLPGQYFDAETGLHQNGYRDYDPSLGRYLQSDPIGLTGGINTYSYVGGNPVTLIDPDGLAGVIVGPGGLPVPIGLPTSGVAGATGNSHQNSSHVPDSRDRSERGDRSDRSWRSCPPKPGNQDPCQGLRKQLEAHERKLADYMSDPMSMDNKGFLSEAVDAGNMDLFWKIRANRIKELLSQIETFRRQLKECEEKYGSRN